MTLKKIIKEYGFYNIIPLIIIIIFIVNNDFLYNINLNYSDILYQRKKNVERKIIILGIDEAANEYFGSVSEWGRDVYADAIYLLNENEQSKPAVIGIDVIFSGEKEEESDDYFVGACADGKNVVVGSEFVFSDAIIEKNDGTFVRSNYEVELYEEPFDKLKAVTRQGFINNMLDVDGIARTGILHVELSEDVSVNSFSYEIYQLYKNNTELYLEGNSVNTTNDNTYKVSDIPVMNDLHHWYVPFSFTPGDCENYSLSDLFTGEIKGEDFEDCIVLIGPYASTLNDSFLTAIDHTVMMYGVEIHANMIYALLDKNFKAYVSDILQYIILFIALVFSGIMFRRQRLVYSVILWFFLSAGYLIFAYFIYKLGYVLQVIYFPLLSTILFVIQIGIHYVKEAIEKREIVSTFKRYVAPQVVDDILNTGIEALELGGRMTDIACLFVDIRGFTTMSETLEPTEVVDILNQYLNLTSECILNNSGTLDKFIGDATMAVFNAPVSLDDYIYKAVKTAWEMEQGSQRLCDEVEGKYGVCLRFGIGVHCGSAVVGNIGTSMRMDYTAIGDTVNTASRLESNAEAGQILISRAVYDALKDRILATSLGNSIKLKGKAEGFEIFMVDEVL